MAKCEKRPVEETSENSENSTEKDSKASECPLNSISLYRKNRSQVRGEREREKEKLGRCELSTPRLVSFGIGPLVIRSTCRSSLARMRRALYDALYQVPGRVK